MVEIRQCLDWVVRKTIKVIDLRTSCFLKFCQSFWSSIMKPVAFSG